MSKLKLDQRLINEAREAAAGIARSVLATIKPCSTLSVERTVLRLLGVNGVNREQVPWPNVIVNRVKERGGIQKGIAHWMGRAMLVYGLELEDLITALEQEELQLRDLPPVDEGRIRELMLEGASQALEGIDEERRNRCQLMEDYPPGPEPLLYVIVATGNIFEDARQAKAAARDGADIVAVIRSTAQSLLDYVPYGATTEGYGGTYATQENFRIMRQALDEVGEELGRYIQLVNYCSGLCMPEIAAMGALERLDMMLNDAMYGILFRDINMKRTFIDQHFSRMINARAGIIINTGEDNYLTTADPVAKAHTVLSSQFINEQLGLCSNLRQEQLGLGHAFEIDPGLEDGLLLEIAQAQLAREIFPHSPLKYMPPTKYMSGNIFHVYLVNGLFNLVSVMTGQSIQLLGMLTEGIHTPHLQDRALSLKNARYVMDNARHLAEEIEFKAGGRIQKRAEQVLRDAIKMLEEIEEIGLYRALAEGYFADIARSAEGGKGREGVFEKDPDYLNPFQQLLQRKEDNIGLEGG